MNGSRWLALVLEMSRDELVHELTRSTIPARRRVLERLING